VSDADAPRGEPLKLVPRMKAQGYGEEDVAARREWVERETGARLGHVAACTIPAADLRGNVENPIGSVQVPLGVAGPLWVRGQHADGRFYVPLATTEGALVRSYERGMAVITRSGGAVVRVYADSNHISPSFFFEDVGAAYDFAQNLPRRFDEIRAAAEATTRHGKLLGIECTAVGRQAIVGFRYDTADAHGMNMIVKATDSACRWIMANSAAVDCFIFSGMSSEKRASGGLFAGGKGKKIVAGARIPAKLSRAYLHASPERLRQLWESTVIGHLRAGALGYNGHYANGLAAMFIACGQDVANVVNSAVGVTRFETTSEGDLYASVTLASLTVATVGGGVALGSSRECLEMMGCCGSGKARKLAEIVAATLLAGELSFGAAIASGEFVAAHESYGRNRPEDNSAE